MLIRLFRVIWWLCLVLTIVILVGAYRTTTEERGPLFVSTARWQECQDLQELVTLEERKVAEERKAAEAQRQAARSNEPPLERALRYADAAGDAEAAKVIAAEVQKQRSRPKGAAFRDEDIFRPAPWVNDPIVRSGNPLADLEEKLAQRAAPMESNSSLTRAMAALFDCPRWSLQAAVPSRVDWLMQYMLAAAIFIWIPALGFLASYVVTGQMLRPPRRAAPQ